MPSAEYHHRQAELAARLALAETDPAKSAALQLLALEQYEKAAKAEGADEPSSSPYRGLILNPEDRIS